eukprot:TRINITY_DN65368_c0_g1_i1.p1 TRINITY_DN65368_c0_g1~~TRINITY_DN65368_c0_g1_i1.p1  ORF type:complete len:356 (-),score=56.01 TRINITY_DN65368_c0_g1_i1:530-1540(-)
MAWTRRLPRHGFCRASARASCTQQRRSFAGAREQLTVCDVGPRDGLQSCKEIIPASRKRQLVQGLYAAGLRSIELTSFVSPKAVPQMADAADVMPVASSLPDLRALALIMNEAGYERAVASGANAFTLVGVCSDSFAQKNNRRPAKETIATAGRIAELAKRDRKWVRVVLAVAWHCPYEGPVDAGQVRAFADEVMSWGGIDELSFADTTGYASPAEVRSLLAPIVDAYPGKVSVHLHDTQSFASANVFAALDAGVRIFDSSVGGLGGCPFAPGAAGNLATEDLVLLAEKLGFETGVNLEKLWEVSHTTAELRKDQPTGGRTKAWWLAQQGKKSSPE